MPLQVLLFEPDKRLAALFESIIQQAAPEADLHKVGSTFEALRIAGTAGPDLLILDHTMVKDARSLLLDFRTYNPLARILLVVPEAMPDGFEQGARDGTVHFLARPFTVGQATRMLGWLLDPAGVAKDSFFQAHLQCVSLVEILRMKVQGGFSTQLEIFKVSGPKGQIVLDRGRIIHASSDTLQGEAAFREILGWNGGLVIEQPVPTPLHQTIQRKSRELLLEAARQQDVRMQAEPPPPAAAPAPPAPACDDAATPGLESDRHVTVGGVKEEELSRFMALPKMLIIDDDPMILHSAEDILGRAWPSHAIIGVESGSEGFECAQLYRPQVVLLDYVLPDYNGDDFALKMRAHPDLSCIPIVLMSGFVNEIRTAALNHQNVIGILAKPFVMDELIELVKRALTMPPPPLHPEVERSLRYAGSLTARILRHRQSHGARHATPTLDETKT